MIRNVTLALVSIVSLFSGIGMVSAFEAHTINVTAHIENAIQVDTNHLSLGGDAVFPEEFHQAMAECGCLGIAMPEEYGGTGLGVTDAALVMHQVARSSGGMSAASAIHINIFGPYPIVVYGTDEQKQRWLPDLIEGRTKTCFGVTEPDAGLDTTSITTSAERDGDHYVVNGRKIWTTTAQEADKIMLLARTTSIEKRSKRTDGLTLFYTDLDRDYVDVRVIPKMGRAAVDSNEVFFDGLPVPAEDRIGEEGRAFEYLPG